MTEVLEHKTRRLVRRYEQAFTTHRDGLVAMMLQQFSKPNLAFREIIQNAVDEGAQNIDVRIEEKPYKHRVCVRIADDGKGMNLEGIKRYLTLFDSTKEGVLEKIGEMGVGKIFAFALDPDYLIIETGKGSEGYKVIFNKDMGGKLCEIPPRQGTRVTVVIPSSKDDVQEVAKDITDSIMQSCRYISPNLTINGERAHVDFDIDTEFKVEYDDKVTKAVLGLTGKNRYVLLKGGIVLEEGDYPLNDANMKAHFYGLELLVDSYRFNQPISRNAVDRDEEFRVVITDIELMKDRLVSNLCDSYRKMKDPNSTKAKLVRGYLRQQILSKECVDLNQSDLKLFETVDGNFLSYPEVIKAAEREGTIYYSHQPANANEITYFTERGIPVLLENLEMVDKVLSRPEGDGRKYGYQLLTDNLIIEGLTGFKRKYIQSPHEISFLSRLKSLAYYVFRMKKKHEPEEVTIYPGQGNLVAKSHPPQVGEFANLAGYRGNEIGNGNGQGNAAFDWEKIRGFRFESFVDFEGNPREDQTCSRLEDTIIINVHCPYVKKMLKLEKSDPGLSMYYLLSEVAASKAVFPNPDHKMVEEFIIALGLNLLENDRQKY